MKSGTCGAPVECPPKAARGMGENLEILIERQFGSVSRVRNWRLPQPQTMFDAPNAQQNMPAVRGVPDFAG
jgi:hypothetical protein